MPLSLLCRPQVLFSVHMGLRGSLSCLHPNLQTLSLQHAGAHIYTPGEEIWPGRSGSSATSHCLSPRIDLFQDCGRHRGSLGEHRRRRAWLPLWYNLCDVNQSMPSSMVTKETTDHDSLYGHLQ